MNLMPLLSDQWWLWIWNNYSISVGLIGVLLKCLAVVSKNNDTNKILDLLQGYFSKPPVK